MSINIDNSKEMIERNERIMRNTNRSGFMNISGK